MRRLDPHTDHGTTRSCSCSTLATRTCACSCGSPAREVRCRNAAAMNPLAAITCARPGPRRGHARAASRDALQVAQRLLDSLLVRQDDDAADPFIAEPEQHAHALRRRERAVEAGTALLK